MDILIIKPSSFGDIIHAMQVASLVARQIPGARIDWIARDIFAPFVKNCAIVNKTHIFDRKNSVSGLLKLRKELKREKYDVVLDMQGLFRSGLMTHWSNAPLKIGRKDSRELSGMFYGRRISLPGAKKPHAVEILMEFLPALGLKKLNLEEIQFKDLSFNMGLNGYILLFPGSRRAEKKWPFFMELTKMFLDAGHPCVWAGAKGDVPGNAISELEARSMNFKNLIGKTQLSELPAVIKKCAFAVCNDSGPMHLAAAMCKNVAAIFGPTDPVKYGPYPLGRDSNAVICASGAGLHSLSAGRVFDFCNEKFPLE